MQDHTSNALRSARRLRREMTLPEVLLWQQLRSQPLGVRFRRQHPIGNHVVDFYCAAKRVAIEIDGIAHDLGDRPQRDVARDARLRGMGIEIVRIAAADILRNVCATAESIARLCADVPPPSGLRPATSPMGGGYRGVAT